MDMNKLKKMIELVRASGIAELEISDNDEKVRITNTPTPAQHTQGSPVHYHAAPQSAAAAPAAAVPTVVVNAIPAVEHRKQITSPMVGTFYRSATPGAKPLVEVGQTIKAGQTVCIIEAMKLMNEIESEHSGVVKEVLVTNEQPVEYGEPLFIIE